MLRLSPRETLYCSHHWPIQYKPLLVENFQIVAINVAVNIMGELVRSKDSKLHLSTSHSVISSFWSINMHVEIAYSRTEGYQGN
jgi:hypothetical protein